MKTIRRLTGTLTTILALSGCAGQAHKDEGKLPGALDEQTAKSIEPFENRPVHKQLTEKIIDTTSNDNLLQTVFDNLCEKQPNDYEKEYETVMSWNNSRQAICKTEDLQQLRVEYIRKYKMAFIDK